METLENLRRQIDTATDLSSVVTTMKTLAAVSIHQYEEAVEGLREYNRTIELGFQIVLRGPARTSNTRQDGDGGRTAAIVFGSDQGMCGQFNEEIVALANRRANRAPSPARWMIHAVGHRAAGQLLDTGWHPDRTYDVPTSVSDITNLVLEMLPAIESLRSQERVSRWLMFYNRRGSASSFTPQQEQLLPLDPALLERWRNSKWESRSLPMFVTGRQRLLSQLTRQYLFVSLFRACAESLASENASRIAAMQAAEKNIEERLEELQGSFHRQRQSAITEELMDVVTGFEALSQHR